MSFTNIRTPRVLVQGVGSHNGGAELLLKAAASNVARWGARPTADVRRVSAKLRREWGLDAHASLPRFGAAESLGLGLLPKTLQATMGVSTSASVRAVLDGSGFAYGDRWSSRSIGFAADLAEKWRRRETPTFLLPQAFGPFERKPVAEASKRLLENVRWIYVRDATSAHHVEQLIGQDERVEQVPDISIALEAPPVTVRDEVIYIVPNINLTGDRRAHFAQYVDSLATTHAILTSEGHSPQVLVHSSLSDPEVVSELKSRIPSLAVKVPANGWEAKILISRAAGLVGGRFHALVSALSSGVPVTAHSWSHKYGQLLMSFDDVGVLSDPFDAEQTVHNLMTAMTDPSVPHRSLKAKNQMTVKIEAMWEDIRERASL